MFPGTGLHVFRGIERTPGRANTEVRRRSLPSRRVLIHKRGRDYENTISIEYLSRLNERYEAWIQSYDKSNLLVIEVDDIDFVKNRDDFSTITKLIDEKLKS